MIQLDLIGSVGLTALLAVGTVLKLPVEASVTWVIASSIAYVYARERITRIIHLETLQQRINKL